MSPMLTTLYRPVGRKELDWSAQVDFVLSRLVCPDSPFLPVAERGIRDSDRAWQRGEFPFENLPPHLHGIKCCSMSGDISACVHLTPTGQRLLQAERMAVMPHSPQ